MAEQEAPPPPPPEETISPRAAKESEAAPSAPAAQKKGETSPGLSKTQIALYSSAVALSLATLVGVTGMLLSRSETVGDVFKKAGNAITSVKETTQGGLEAVQGTVESTKNLFSSDTAEKKETSPSSTKEPSKESGSLKGWASDMWDSAKETLPKTGKVIDGALLGISDALKGTPPQKKITEQAMVEYYKDSFSGLQYGFKEMKLSETEKADLLTGIDTQGCEVKAIEMRVPIHEGNFPKDGSVKKTNFGNLARVIVEHKPEAKEPSVSNLSFASYYFLRVKPTDPAIKTQSLTFFGADPLSPRNWRTLKSFEVPKEAGPNAAAQIKRIHPDTTKEAEAPKPDAPKSKTSTSLETLKRIAYKYC